MEGIRTALALAVTVLATAAPVATAGPDGHQPQLRADDQPDAFMRAFQSAPSSSVSNESDVVARYLRNHAAMAGAGLPALHPDSLAVRPGVVGGHDAPVDGGIDWTTGGIGLGVGLLIAALAVGTAFATSGRRGRLVLR